ncbi:putative snRNA-activating protein complex subunit 3 [Blattamonas nauphoetae]|uniref:snRNA-activating protein complex subunit 3 n=1 Tax=Blattamonas nauphoetae TaxID=2049346 RepID=A0ABQ9XRQ5_9EUKA|nr:putative snRNA-activating protein complex subunit 3 [Blattamonas nauphoetae]
MALRTYVSLKSFQDALTEAIPRFEEDFIPEGWSQDQASLDCSQYVQRSRKQVIEDAISTIIEEEIQSRIYDQQFDPVENSLKAQQLAMEDNRPCQLSCWDYFRRRNRKEVKSTRGFKQINYIASMMKEPTNPADMRQIAPNEVILTVSLYNPNKQLKQQEFHVLGSQVLTDLRDRLYCLADYLYDTSPIRPAFFLIENTFYNDSRSGQTQDYSEPIMRWLEQDDRNLRPGLGAFATRPMEQTTFLDLNIKIGQPYLYVHQGNCEHTIVFSEARIISPDDVQDANLYPRHIFQAKIRRRKCKICDIFPARCVTYSDRMATDDPYFYCDHCYRPLHYTSDNRLLFTDFETFPYYHE